MRTPSVIVILLCISIAWAAFAFLYFIPSSRSDWDQFLTYHQIQNTIILGQKQLPLWNNFICGGEPWLGHPESDFLSPFYPVILAGGIIAGTVAYHCIYLFIGLLGIYFLCRSFRLESCLSLLGAVFYLYCVNVVTFNGSFTLLNLSWLPWIWLTFRRSPESPRSLFFTALLLSVCIYSGSGYVYILGSMLIACEALCGRPGKDRASAAVSVLKVWLFSFIMLAPKLLPIAELLSAYPRLTPGGSGAHLIQPAVTGQFLAGLKHVFLSGSAIFCASPHKDLAGFNIPVPVAALIIFAHLAAWKRAPQLVLINLIFIFLGMGDESPLDLKIIFHALIPSFKTYRVFLLASILSSGVLLGLAIDELCARLKLNDRWRQALALASFTLVLYATLTAALKLFERAKGFDYRIVSEQTSPFVQTYGNPERMLGSVLKNQGVVNAYDSIGNQIDPRVLPVGTAGYRGEYYLLHNSGEARLDRFSSGMMRFSVEAAAPDILVVNQNYFPGWHYAGGSVIKVNGLLGVRLPAGKGVVELRYMPVSFIWGMVVFVIGIPILLLQLRRAGKQ